MKPKFTFEKHGIGFFIRKGQLHVGFTWQDDNGWHGERFHDGKEHNVNGKSRDVCANKLYNIIKGK